MKNARRTIGSVAAAGVALAAVPGLLSGQAAGEYRVSGDRVAIYNLAGQVQVRGGSGSDVVVQVRSGGDDRDELRVETGRIGGRETLRIVYPDDRIVYPEMSSGSRNSMRVRNDGTWGEGGGRRVRISGSGGGLEAFADLTISVPPGKEFSMYLAVGEIRGENLDGRIRLDTGSGRITASGLRGEAILDTGSGSVEIRGMEGDLLVDTGSGSVEAYDVQGDELEVDTGSGSVRGSDLAAGRVRVDTGSGSVRLDRLSSPDVWVDTGSGSVELELMADADRVYVDTGSGGVTLRVPEDFGAELELETGSGGIDVDLPVRIESMERDHLLGVLGDGRGSVRVDTGSGGVRIRRR